MSTSFENNYWKFKVILAGEAGVGKTTLVTRYISGGFSGEYRATIGCYVFTKKFEEDNIELQIWDIAGQILFRDYRKKFFVNSHGVFLVFDQTVPSSLEKLDFWISDIQEVSKGPLFFILIGNKKDLNELQAINPSEIETFLTKHDSIISYSSTSAKTGENVDSVFFDLFNKLKKG
jgi:small GTP-binding protein